MQDILSLSVPELLKLYRQKKLSPVEAAKAALTQTQEFNPSLNAYILVADEQALLDSARKSEARWNKGAPQGALDGVPVSIKDWYHVTGWPTRYGSLTSSADIQKEDSPVVARLRESGALFLGKTTLPEYGHKGATFSPVSGVTRNPWNPQKTPGGSSGGDGAAAAARMGFLHLGSDAGGSIRIPASFCGVFGIKPTPGLVPHWPPSPFSPLSSAGPMTRTVEEASLMMDVITQPDARDWNAVPYQKRNFATALGAPAGKLKVAYARTINDTPIDAEIADFVSATVKKMQSFGTVEEITLNIPTLIDTFNKHWMAAAAWKVSLFSDEERRKMDPYFLEWARRGGALSRDSYISAELERMMIGAQMKELLDEYDVLVMPTTAVTAFDADRNMPNALDGNPWEDWTPLTFPANLARLPAASVPCGITKAGLPCGVQIVAGYLKDDVVLRVSHALEREIGFQDWIARQAQGEMPALRKAGRS